MRNESWLRIRQQKIFLFYTVQVINDNIRLYRSVVKQKMERKR